MTHALRAAVAFLLVSRIGYGQTAAVPPADPTAAKAEPQSVDGDLVALEGQRLNSRAAAEAAAENRREAAAPATVEGGFVVPRPEITLESTRDEKKATARIGRSSKILDLEFKVTGPLDESTAEAVPLSLDGFVGSTSAEAAFAVRLGAPKLEDTLDAMCTEILGKGPKDPCDSSEFVGMDRKRFNDAMEELFKQQKERARNAWVLAARGKGGRKKFKYAATDSLTTQSVNRNNWSITGMAGRHVAQAGFLSVSFQYERAFKDGADAKNLCVQTQTDGVAECGTVVAAPPKQETSKIAAISLRRRFGDSAGIGPVFRHDFEDKTTSFELPIYFLQGIDKDKKPVGLTGGIRAGWHSKEGPVLAVFIGATFLEISVP